MCAICHRSPELLINQYKHSARGKFSDRLPALEIYYQNWQEKKFSREIPMPGIADHLRKRQQFEEQLLTQ